MFGLSSSIKTKISTMVEDLFDNIAMQFVGDIPKLKNKRLLIISSKPNLGLPNLFVQSMQNKTPNEIEADVLKSLLDSAHGYVESLKNKTMSNVTESLDGLVREANLQNRSINDSEIKSILSEELDKAKSHMKTIAESEATKLRNLGSAMDITRVASNLSDSDPVVFFQTLHDNLVCKECIRLHLMPDKITPRLWRISELKSSYGKRGDEVASLFGRHPGDRCTLSYLVPGFGFDSSGKLTYISENFDAVADQRK